MLIGDLVTNIRADATQFNSTLEDVRRRVNALDKGMKFIGKGFGIASTAYLFQSLLNYADKTDPQIKKLKQSFDGVKSTLKDLNTQVFAVFEPLISYLISGADDAARFAANIFKAARALTDFVGLTTEKKSSALDDRDIGFLANLKVSSTTTARTNFKSTTDLFDNLSFGANKLVENLSVDKVNEMFFDPLVKSTLEMTSSIAKFNDSLQQATSAIDEMIKSNLDSKGNEELNRILKDKFKNPWELTSEQQKTADERRAFYKEMGLTDDEAQTRLKASGLTEERPDTSAFDRQLQDAFDLIQGGAFQNQEKIQSLLKDAEGGAKSLGMQKAVDEFRNFNDNRLNPAKSAAQKVDVNISVAASPDFITKVTTSEDFKEGVNTMVALEAAASAAVEAAR